MMDFLPTFLDGVYTIQLSPFIDDRGSFSRLFCNHELSRIGLASEIVQVNHSVNKDKGTIRGMHFQYPPDAEIKIIRCIKGKVFDVVVDLRENSSTFLKWFGMELASEKYNMMYIPQGCAHGFQTLEENCELLYFHTAFYKPTSEGAIRFDDPMISIQWPLEPVNISLKDKSYPFINDTFRGIQLS